MNWIKKIEEIYDTWFLIISIIIGFGLLVLAIISFSILW